MLNKFWSGPQPSLALMVASGVAASFTAAFLLRAAKRSMSPKICCKLKCKCGQVEGQILVKREDAQRLWCYCEDCQDYGKFVAAQGNHPDGSMVGPGGESRLVQVCKSDLAITKGREQMQLCRKYSKPAKKGEIYMHRYYTKCCHTPLCQTIDFLGFCAVYADFLDDNQDKLNPPVASQVEKASKPPVPKLPNLFLPSFFWNMLRYQPYRNMGPFDYDQEPVYWGGEVSKEM